MTVREKAARLLREKRVHYQFTTPDGALVYWVDGDSGRTRTVTFDPDGQLTCDCPALIPDCAHRLAVQDLHQPIAIDRDAGRGSLLSPDTPIEHIPTPQTRADLAALPDPDEPVHPVEDVTDITHPVVYDGGDDAEDVEVVGDDGPRTLAGSEQRRDLIELAEAPFNFRALENISTTEFVNRSIRGKPAAMMAAVFYGRELGIGPMQSLDEIAVIDGSPNPSADLLLGLFRRAGHRLEVLQNDDQAATIKGTRGDTGEELTVSFTLDDAVKAGLVSLAEDGTPRARSQRGQPLPWERYTRDMLWHRAVSRLCRKLARDAIGMT